jgi:hypothetical protein
MMIRLKDSYRGKPSRERVIAPGEYAEDDERLFGLADYLVKNGYAVKVAGKAKDSSKATEDALAFPDLTAAQVAEIRSRYERALALQAKWQDAKAARADAPPALQGEEIYGATGDVLTMDAGDTVVVPGKGVVPDVILPKAAWQMLETTVILVPDGVSEPTTLTTAPGGEVLRIPAEQVEAFPDGYHYDKDGNIVPDETEDGIPWEDASAAAFADTPEYRTLVQERQTAMDEAGNDTRKLNRVSAEYDKKIKAAHQKWEADQG